MAMGPQERVLIEIMTTANLAGVKEAKAGFMGMNPAVLAAGIGLGLLVEVGKSVLETSDKEEAAAKSLAQAYATLGEAVPTKAIENFINTNARFLPGVAETEQAFASLARAGFSDTMQIRLMNDAMDLAVAKNITLTEATDVLIKAHAGQARALTTLGISQKEINASVAKGATTEEKYAALLAKLEPRINNAREAIDHRTQSQKELNIATDQFAAVSGPGIATALDKVTQAATTGVEILTLYADLILKITGPGGLVQKFVGSGSDPGANQAMQDKLAGLYGHGKTPPAHGAIIHPNPKQTAAIAEAIRRHEKSLK